MKACNSEKKEVSKTVEETTDENARIGQQCFDNNNNKNGGWITFPFIIVAIMGLSLAATGWMANLVVYAIEQYNMKEISAAKLHNIAIGGMTFVSIVGAILADSWFGSFSIFIVASFISLLGSIMLTLSATLPSLRPPPCSISSSVECQLPSPHQQGFLYVAVALAVIGAGGTSFVLGTIGANQFPASSEQQRMFFDWFIVAQQLSEVIGYTVIVYVQSNVSWGLGYGLCVAANTVAIGVFLCGLCFYQRMKPRPQGGSSFSSIARVLVASIRKMNTKAPTNVNNGDCYFYGTSTSSTNHKAPSNSLRFFNRAALKTADKDDSDSNNIRAFAKSWSLCTVNEVEDLKMLVQVLPIFSAGIVPSIIFGLGFSLVVLQALVMDRSMGSNFKIPAGSMFIFILLLTCLGISILDRVIHPLMQRIVNRSPTPLQCIGVGYFLGTLGLIAYALVEKKRLDLVKTRNLMEQAHAMAPMSVFWLVVPLGFMGFSSSFYFSTLMRFYYQELPSSLKNTATALMGLQFSIGTYLGTIVLSVVQNTTTWLPHDINRGHLDYLYWMLTILGTLNFMYYLLCSKFYEYNRESNNE